MVLMGQPNNYSMQQYRLAVPTLVRDDLHEIILVLPVRESYKWYVSFISPMRLSLVYLTHPVQYIII